MAKPKRGSSTGGDGGWTASQVVAHNLTQARELRGMTQTEVAERLSRFTGTAWTATTVAQAEGSVTGNRVRQFTANELVALARTFDLPVLYFFLPPEDRPGRCACPTIAGRGSPWEYLLLLVWGHTGNFPEVADRAAPWAHASTVARPASTTCSTRPRIGVLRRRGHARPPHAGGHAGGGLQRPRPPARCEDRRCPGRRWRK